MSTRYAIYNAAGLIQRVVACPEDHLPMQLQAGEQSTPMPTGDDGLFYVLNGAITAKPASPGDGFVFDPVKGWVDTRSITDLRAKRWNALKTQRNALDFAPITVPASTFQVDADAQSRADIMGAIMAMQLANLPMTTPRNWRCSDNVLRPLLMSDLAAVGQAIAARRQKLIEISSPLWTQIQAAQTPADVAAVVWPAVTV